MFFKKFSKHQFRRIPFPIIKSKRTKRKIQRVKKMIRRKMIRKKLNLVSLRFFNFTEENVFLAKSFKKMSHYVEILFAVTTYF